MGPARAGLARDALGSLAVIGVVALTAFGLPLFDRAVPADRPVAAGVAYPVGGGVIVSPPAGTVVDVSRTRPGRDRGVALFENGSTRVVLVVTPYRGDLAAAVERLRHKLTRTGSRPDPVAAPTRTGE